MRKKNIILSFNGRNRTLAELAKKYGFLHATLYRRIILNNIPIKDAIKKGHLGVKSKNSLLSSLKDRLLSNYSIDKRTGCWNWMGCKHLGYGMIGFGTKNLIRTHRASYLVHFGELPPDLDCCHTCDNPSCINPKHLFLGTEKDNMQDMISKGRKPILKGENSTRWTIPDAIVYKIRKEYNGEYGQQTKLAKKYNIRQGTVSNIVLGRSRI